MGATLATECDQPARSCFDPAQIVSHHETAAGHDRGPVFNTNPEELLEAVESARAQTYPHTEIVVVDDGSTRPETTQALAMLEGVRLLRQDNAGTGAALNAGVRASSGELLIALGSDDWIEQDFVEKLVAGMGDQVTIAYPVVKKFGAEIGLLSSPSQAKLADIAVANKVVATALFRRRHWEEAGGFNEDNGLFPVAVGVIG